MSKRFVLGAAMTVLVFSAGALSTVRTNVSAASLPSSKAAVAISNLVSLSKASAGDLGSATDTGWQSILTTQIKTSSQKDLAFDVALQCGVVTDTTVKSSGGSTSTSTARASIAVRVLVDGVAAEPNNSIDAAGESASGVVYCDRIQTLAARFAGLNCTADLTGAVTCLDPETLQLILKTLNANAFNFAKADVGVGVHNVVVQARGQASVALDGTSGSLAGAQAFAGAGSLRVEELRLIRGAQIVTID
jgi:hypothetical protein